MQNCGVMVDKILTTSIESKSCQKLQSAKRRKQLTRYIKGRLGWTITYCFLRSLFLSVILVRIGDKKNVKHKSGVRANKILIVFLETIFSLIFLVAKEKIAC